jgi:hypothetical protein
MANWWDKNLTDKQKFRLQEKPKKETKKTK